MHEEKQGHALHGMRSVIASKILAPLPHDPSEPAGDTHPKPMTLNAFIAMGRVERMKRNKETRTCTAWDA